MSDRALTKMAIPPEPPKRKTFSLPYGAEKIRITRVSRSSEKNRLKVMVHPDGRVIVHAPESATDEDVLRATKRRIRWISEKIEYFRSQQTHVLPRSYVSGESHFYLGKRYMLKVHENTMTPQGVKLLRGSIEVSVKKKSTEKVRDLLDVWYKDRAKEVFMRRLNAILPQTLWVKQQPPVRILCMKTQWGSCSPQGRLTLNPHLVKANRDCIDYVLLHELCHIAEHNHSEKFYRLMNRVMPKWEKTKDKLDKMADALLAE